MRSFLLLLLAAAAAVCGRASNQPDASAKCTYVLGGSEGSFDPGRTSAALTLETIGAACPWQASSSSTWVQVFPVSGSNSATIRFTVFPNFSVAQRTATLTIGGQTFTVTQAAGTGTAMQRYVRLLYFNFFGRMPSSAEVAFQSNAGLSREQLALNFFNSNEFNAGGRFVAGLYVGLMNRDAEYGGWLFQRDALSVGLTTPDALVYNFLQSDEFVLRNGPLDLPSLVRLLYRQILLREPGAAEVDFQVTAIETARQDRVTLARAFLTSAEFRLGTGPRLTAFLAYAALLQREPTLQEMQSAQNKSLSQLIADLLASTEFVTAIQ